MNETSRVSSIALTARLGYLAHVPLERVDSWSARVSDVLDVGREWLLSCTDDERPLIDGADVYERLLHYGFRPLITLQKEAGEQELLAVLVLLLIERGERDAAFQLWASLRHFRQSALARNADRVALKRRPLMAKANKVRLAEKAERASKVRRLAERMAANGTPRKEIVGIVALRLQLSASQVRKILSA